MVMEPQVPSLRSASGGPDPSGDIYQRLLKERIVFLGSAIDQTTANLVCAQLVLLEAEDHERDIMLYINSPGGSVTDGLAIYDTMQYVRCDLATICMGQASSMGSFLLCAGTRGKRYSLPNSRILIHQPLGGFQGQATDIDIHAREILKTRDRLIELYSKHSGQAEERVRKDMERDYFMSAAEAREYGIIDEILVKKKPNPTAAK